MIKRLLLSNWRSHKHSEIGFAKGTNILVGIMGSGKTSVIDAICFALFGTFPKLARKDTKLSDVLRRDTEDGEVSLEFDADGKEYKVRRVYGTKSDAELYMGGRLVEKTPKAVTKYVQDALGIDYDLFSRAIYAEQNKIDYFLSLDPKRRKEEIDGLLGLDRFESARAGALAAGNKLRVLREAIEKTEPSKRASESEKKLLELEKQAKESSEKMDSERKKLDSLAGKLRIAKSGLESLEKQDTAARKMEGELAASRRTYMMLEREISELSALDGKFSEHEEKLLSAEYDTLAKAHSQLQKETVSLSSKCGMLREKLASCQKAKKAVLEAEAKLGQIGTPEGIAKEIALVSGQIEKLESERALALAKKSEAEEASRILRDGTAKCPVCDCELSEEKCAHIRKEKSEKAAHYGKIGHEHSEKLAHAQSQKRELEEKEKKARLILQQIERERDAAHMLEPVQKELALVETQSEKAGKEFAQSDSAMRKLSDRLAALEAAKKATLQIAKRKGEYSKEKERNVVLEAELSKLKVELGKLSGARATYSELAAQEKSVSTAIGYIQMIAKRFESDIESEKKLHAQFVSAQSEAKSLALAEEKLAIYKNCLALSQSALRSELVEAINSALSSLWGAVYPYYDITAVRLSATERDYVFEARVAGEWKEIDSVASGGERACLCIALRIAFATVLVPRLSWLILDEPTHNLDSEATLMLRSTLEERIPSIVEQTIVITHEQALVDTDAKVYCLLRDKGKNEPTKIVPAGSIDA